MVGVRMSMSPGRVVRRTAPVAVLVLLASYLVAPEFAGAAPPPRGSDGAGGAVGAGHPGGGADAVEAGYGHVAGVECGVAGLAGRRDRHGHGGHHGGGGGGEGGGPAAGSPGVGTVGGLPLRVRKQGPAGSAPASDPRSEARRRTRRHRPRCGCRWPARRWRSRRGSTGVLFTLARGDGSTVPTQVALDVDYSGFATAYGGDFGGRLRLVRLPGCALTTPDLPECHVPAPVDGR